MLHNFVHADKFAYASRYETFYWVIWFCYFAVGGIYNESASRSEVLGQRSKAIDA